MPDTELRLIVGVDYGTTYSGISWATTGDSGIENIHVLQEWPGREQQTHWKVPTRVAYVRENADKISSDVTGFRVKSNLLSCSWTKLLLDDRLPILRQRAAGRENTDTDRGILRLPEPPVHKTAQDVCQDFLAQLFAHFTDTMTRKFGATYMKVHRVDYWITVPAMWSDAAKDATNKAALAAGFGSRNGDTLNVISEPEAAAITSLKKYTLPNAPNPPKAGEGILVCDCGGGTVDVIAYTLKELRPSLKFEEICDGAGDKCGSTYIDRALYRLMQQRFGRKFTQLNRRQTGPESTFMAEWETIKGSFGIADGDQKSALALNMKHVNRPVWYDEDDGTVILTNADIKELFDPVVERIIELISDQVAKAKTKRAAISRLVLVGGFGRSIYLYNRVNEWCRSHNILVVSPLDPQAAVVQGAVLRGLEGTTPTKRHCRRHYGVAIGMPFREGQDPKEQRYKNMRGQYMCRGRMKWIMPKGGVIEEKGTSPKVSLIEEQDLEPDKKRTVYLYSCAYDVPPEYVSDQRLVKVGNIEVDYNSLDKSEWQKTKIGFHHNVWSLVNELELNFGASSGMLEAAHYVGGKVVGKATMKYE